VLHPRTAIEYRTGIAAAVPPVLLGVDTFADEIKERRSQVVAERAIDEILADSFPASDPPSWNSGIVRPDPQIGLTSQGARSESIANARARTGVSYALDVSRPSGDRTFLQGVMSLGGGASLSLLVPVAILLVGLPIALSVRGVLELIAWLFSVNIG
jgi:hypothetical protein